MIDIGEDFYIENNDLKLYDGKLGLLLAIKYRLLLWLKEEFLYENLGIIYLTFFQDHTNGDTVRIFQQNLINNCNSFEGVDNAYIRSFDYIGNTLKIEIEVVLKTGEIEKIKLEV